MSASASAELAELVNDHVNGGPALDPAIGGLVMGLANLMTAFGDARAKRGNWGAILGNLREGTGTIDAALAFFQRRKTDGLADLLDFAERQSAFARTLIDDVLRLQAGESTLV